MPAAFITKLNRHAMLPAEDVDALRAICRNQRDFPAQHDLVLEGDRPGPVSVILSGWACRYKLLPEGTRQITSFLMPGDCCDLHASVLEQMDHSITTLTPARVAMVPRARLEELVETRPLITRAFWWNQLVEEETLRAWIVSIGRRKPVQRVAHLACELYVRASNVGLADGGTCQLPLTQVVLGDALGLTPVHVNRVLRTLRENGAMELRGGNLRIANVSKLTRIAGFDDNYLHQRMRSKLAISSG